MTTSIPDAAVAGNVLNRILKIHELDNVLSEYAEIYRKVFLEFTNPLSIAKNDWLRQWTLRKSLSEIGFSSMLKL